MNRSKRSGIRKRRARCKYVLAVFNNRIEVVQLLREETHNLPESDFNPESAECAVVKFKGIEVTLPLESVVFCTQ